MQLILCSFLLLFIGCASPPKKESNTPSTSRETSKKTSIDIRGLKTLLSLDRSVDELGFQEKAFDPCSVGYKFSGPCREQYLVVVNFRVQCRNSEGTVSTALEESDLFPIKGETLRWRLKGLEGISQIDDHGFGQIETVSEISQRKQWLRLSNSDDFLMVRAGEINRVVTPKNWCDPRKYSP